MKTRLIYLCLVPLVCFLIVLAVMNQLGIVTINGPDLSNYLPWGAPKISFNDEVQPILSSNCYLCHGPDSGSRKANLRLDRPNFAFLPRDNGKPVLISGHPEQSEVYLRITSADPNAVMPPVKSHHELSSSEIHTIKTWIRQGAKYEEHWSYIKPVRPPLPSVSFSHWNWPKNPIDHFVLSKLEQKNLEPQPEADPRSLIRRVTLDLTGLPPTPEEMDAFLQDKSPNAYEKVVDRLLASPHYGEQEGRYWLDAARYADTHGIHFDNYRSMWPYRDWVINAFNTNMPFDEFTVEQLAGDLLPNATLEQKIASGFNRCALSTGEGGSINDEVLAMYAKDRVDTTSEVFMGETMGCAACHDHKFDPISQKDFYSMASFFRNTTQPALDQNREDAPPSIRIPSVADRPRWEALPNEITSAKQPIAERLTATDKSLPNLITDQKWLSTLVPVSSVNLDLSLQLREGAGITIKSNLPDVLLKGNPTPKWVAGAAGKGLQFDGKITAEFPHIADYDTSTPFSVSLWVKAGKKGSGVILAHEDPNDDMRGWQVNLDQRKPTISFNSGPQKTMRVTSEKELPDGWTNVLITYDGSGKSKGVMIYIGAKSVPTKSPVQEVDGSIHVDVPLRIGSTTVDGPALNDTALQDIRVYHSLLSMGEVHQLAKDELALALNASGNVKQWTADQRSAYESLYLDRTDSSYQNLVKRLDSLVAEQDAIRQRSPTTLVMEEKPEAPFGYILKRGQYDQLGDKVYPDVPSIFPPLPEPRNRLGLAKWLVGPDHPLLARVTINRYWQQMFGVGIVKTSEDFGIMGERPVNQPLLDWLAVEFRESGWNVKHMLKLMAMSASYRQSSEASRDVLELDPENRLVSRGPRYRLDGEEVRDQALAASGLLKEEVGGPSVKPYQPTGVWEAVAMPPSNTKIYKQDTGASLYRRSMYTFWKRSAPPPSLDTFNAPSRETCVVRRERTNTPLQALVVMNDPQFVEAARHLAINAIHEAGKDPTERLNYMAERLLARPLSPNEVQVLSTSLQKFMATYAKRPDEASALLKIGDSPQPTDVPPSEQAAWTMVASQFLNLDETLNK